MSRVTILHNPRCSKSREAVKVADAVLGEASSTEVVIRPYLAEPLSRDELASVLDALGTEPRTLVRSGDKAFTELGLTDADIATGQQVIDLLAEHPALMQRPVLIAQDKAVIGRPMEDAEEFLRKHA